MGKCGAVGLDDLLEPACCDTAAIDETSVLEFAIPQEFPFFKYQNLLIQFGSILDFCGSSPSKFKGGK